MSRRTNLIVPVQNNGAAGTKTVNIPAGYDVLAIDHVGATCTAADMTNFKQVVNSTPWRDLTGTDQDNISREDMLAAMSVDNTLRVQFELSRMKQIAAQYSTTLNTLAPDPITGNQIQTLQHQWTDTTTDVWSVWAEVDDNAPKAGPGGVERFFKTTIGISASSTFSMSLAPYLLGGIGTPQNRWLHAVYLLTTGTATLDNGETRIIRGAAGQIMFDRLAKLNVRLLTDAGVRSIPTDYITASGGMIIDTTETSMQEMIDSMTTAPAGTPKNAPGAATMLNYKGFPELVVPWNNFDIRLSPTATDTLEAILRTLGTV